MQKKQRTETNSAKNLLLLRCILNDDLVIAHRAHCSNVGVTKYADTAVVGYLMQKEIDFLENAVNNLKDHLLQSFGGAKVSARFNQ